MQTAWDGCMPMLSDCWSRPSHGKQRTSSALSRGSGSNNALLVKSIYLTASHTPTSCLQINQTVLLKLMINHKNYNSHKSMSLHRHGHGELASVSLTLADFTETAESQSSVATAPEQHSAQLLQYGPDNSRFLLLTQTKTPTIKINKGCKTSCGILRLHFIKKNNEFWLFIGTLYNRNMTLHEAVY